MSTLLKSIMLAGASALAISAPPMARADDADQVQAVVVTAQKRSQLLTQVPISAMAITQDMLDRQGVKDITDIARLSPGLTLQGTNDSGDVNIAIRGVISSVGAPTTGVYIDDVPIQVRQDAAVWSNPYPKVFDLDRVEILRGPQGTLYGGSSEGGALRFITPQASLTKTSGFVRSDLAATSHGAPSWELGAAYGAPLIEDKLGYRVSLWRQEVGGYASRVDPVTGAVLGTNVNGSQTTVAHLSLKAEPVSRLTLTPALFYQDVRDDDRGLFWEKTGSQYTISSKIPSPHHDHMVLATLGAEYDFSAFTVKSVSGYIYRVARYQYDSTQYQFASYADLPTVTTLPTDPNYLVNANFKSSQQSYSQELRLTSTDGPDTRLSWVGGLFYQHAREGYDGRYRDNIDEIADYTSQYDGNGPSDSLTYFNEAPVGGLYSFIHHYVDSLHETAAFGDATLRITPRLKVSAGVRYAENGYAYDDYQDGPWGPKAPTTKSGKLTETSVTPRVNLTYNLSTDQMVYASAAKGYRVGGVNQPVPSDLCSEDLGNLGLTSAPDTFGSDSLWSYEAGLKGRFLNGTLLLESSLFWIDWSNIQQSVSLSRCGYSYIANLGRATSRGFDAQVQWAATDHLTLFTTFGLTDAFSNQTVEQDGAVLAQKGDALSTPKWTFTFSPEYRFTPWAAARGYARLDYRYASGYNRSGSDGVYGVDPLIRKAPAVNDLSGRIGVKFQDWDVSVYANNIFNAHTSTYRYRDSIDTTEGALRDARLRPLTAGVSAQLAF
jgi:iron complex outermembrane receptor protein